VYDAKGRFVVHRISAEEANYKLCKVRRMQFGKGGIPYIGTHDGRTIRYPDPEVKEQDTVVLDLTTGKIREFIKVNTSWARIQGVLILNVTVLNVLLSHHSGGAAHCGTQ
jgi:ribosomal protein S4E